MDVVRLPVPGSLEEPVGDGPRSESTLDSTSPGIRAVQAMFQQLHGSGTGGGHGGVRSLLLESLLFPDSSMSRPFLKRCPFIAAVRISF